MLGAGASLAPVRPPDLRMGRTPGSRPRTGEPTDVELRVRFLEVDPYCHRSGYPNAEPIQVITRAGLAPPHIDRLRYVVLDRVDGVAYRGFRSYIRLSRRVHSDACGQHSGNWRRYPIADRSTGDLGARRHGSGGAAIGCG